ncbi:MAG: rubrerythrin family protein [Candidatus Levyibacteriota bacterium]
MGTNRIRKPGDGRRAFLRGAGALLAGVGLGARRLARAATGAYPATVAALLRAFQRETDAHRRYLAFAGTASQEGYKGIAYMFTAFATSEGLHARNFKRLVTQLGGDANAAPTAITPGTTKQNLITAVDDEIDSIDKLYPHTLESIRPEGYDEATRLVRFAWESERQHRELIQKIRRFSPLMFEQVAKSIDQKTGLYFVCQICGSTLNRIPSPSCPVCGGPPAQYVQVPVPG